MNIKKYIKYLICTLVLAGSALNDVYAQQDPMYTHYMDNLLIINPGYAGSKSTANFMAVARNQWLSFDGAPKTRTFSFHTPVENTRVGLGISLYTDNIGPLRQNGLYFDYSYFLKLNEDYKLAMGLKGGFSFYRAGYTELETINPDPIYSRDVFKNFLPNFGVGGFIFSDDTYVGISVPRLVENVVGREEYSSEYIMKENIHLYLVGGKTFAVNEDIKLKGHSMLKLVKNAPVAFDVTAMGGFMERFWAGALFRFGGSWGLLAQFSASPQVTIGYSYDLSYSALNTFNNGTHEIMVSYNMNLFK